MHNNELSSLFIELGLTEPTNIILNGTIQRITLANKSNKDKSGWYIGWEIFTNGKDFTSCVIGNWVTGEKSEYKSWESSSYSLTDSERAEIAQHQKRIADEQEKERKKKQKQAYEKARNEWRDALIDGSSDYLIRKQIKPHSIKFSNGSIIIPVTTIDNKIVGLQRIFNNGAKSYLEGTQPIGNFHLIGNSLIDGDTVLFCEGYSTSSSIHEATGLTVISCFGAGNLLPVIQSWRKKYPLSHFVICADNDQFKAKNTGIEAAKNVIENVKNCSMVYPIFDGLNVDDKPTDFNDLHCLAGLDAVKNRIETAIQAIENEELASCEEIMQSTAMFIREGWQAELLEAIQFINQDHALVLTGAKYLVMKTWRNSENRKERIFLPVKSFIDFYANRTVMTGTRLTGTPIIEGLGKAWLEHSARADYKNGICFEPSIYPKIPQSPVSSGRGCKEYRRSPALKSK
jgi:phage/plasmid primase-like uncharacterized protein